MAFTREAVDRDATRRRGESFRQQSHVAVRAHEHRDTGHDAGADDPVTQLESLLATLQAQSGFLARIGTQNES